MYDYLPDKILLFNPIDEIAPEINFFIINSSDHTNNLKIEENNREVNKCMKYKIKKM